MSRTTPFLLLPLLFTACNSRDTSSSPEVREIVEVLQHDEGTFTRGQVIPVGGVDSTFAVDGTTFIITNRWPHADAAQEVTDDLENERHAVEVGWAVEGGEEIQWFFQAGSEGALNTVEALGAKVRVTRAGARPHRSTDSSFPGQVQFLWEQRCYELPVPGNEAFAGWTLKRTKAYEHALLDEQGGVTEAQDANFKNRVLEVVLTDGKGTEERHLAFLDHPEITKGIHPTILPVARISGEGASQSRLVVCSAVEPPVGHQLVHLTPVVEGPGFTVRVWPKGSMEFETTAVPQLPAELPLTEGGVLHLKRHFTRARSQLKWERFDLPADGEAKPALVIEHRASHHQKSRFVLIRDEVTPCRIGDQHLMLRYVVEGR